MLEINNLNIKTYFIFFLGNHNNIQGIHIKKCYTKTMYTIPFHDVLVRNEIYFVTNEINFVTNEFFFVTDEINFVMNEIILSILK